MRGRAHSMSLGDQLVARGDALQDEYKVRRFHVEKCSETQILNHSPRFRLDLFKQLKKMKNDLLLKYHL